MTYAVSFILPALNESQNIRGAITSIHRYASCLDAYEIIVVDNGSTDDTVQIAQNEGAIVYCKPGLTVGALRNFGASKAQYTYLAFLDADVFLSHMWRERIIPVLNRLSEKAFIITGSTCGIGDNPSLIEYCWWGQVKDRKRLNYINSGHMVLRRDVFHKLGGFDEELTTGEDVEFCQRQRDVKVEILDDAALSVVHEGYPKTWYQFFKRERWHGLGDYSSFSLFMRSKPALIATIQATLLISSLAFCVVTGNYYWLLLYPSFILPVYFLAAYQRSPAINRCLMVNACLYMAYFWARAFALLGALSKRNYSRKR